MEAEGIYTFSETLKCVSPKFICGRYFDMSIIIYNIVYYCIFILFIFNKIVGESQIKYIN